MYDDTFSRFSTPVCDTQTQCHSNTALAQRRAVKTAPARESLCIKRGRVSVRSYVCNVGLVANDVIMRTGAASAVGARRANDVTVRMTS